MLTLGFPVPSIEGFNPKLTDGIISSLTGLRDDPDDIQITAPVQPENSGGALISENGILLGVVAAKANEEIFYAQSSSLPQNISYAKKSALLKVLLQNSRLHPVAETAPDRKSAIKNLVQATALILVYHAPDPAEVAARKAHGKAQLEIDAQRQQEIDARAVREAQAETQRWNEALKK